MFKIENFIAQCLQAIKQTEPTNTIKQLVQQAIANPDHLKQALASHTKSRSLKDSVLFLSDTLTLLPATTPTGLHTPAHDHQMWAVIGIYEGAEHNDFFLEDVDGLKKKSSKVLRKGEVAVLNKNTIHAVSNPLDVNCYAIHIYGGNLVNQPGRSMWNPHTLKREPYDIDKLSAYIMEMRQLDKSEEII